MSTGKLMSAEVLNGLNLTEAATDEAGAWRNLLPPEPWQSVVAAFPEQFGNYARHRLEAGVECAPSVVVRTRKPNQQVRPVAVVGLPERISYRALATAVLKDADPMDRSSDAYRSFVGGPIRAAFDGRSSMRLVESGDYVIESDIVAFYEYIDHSRLLAELELRTSSVAGPRALGSLLGQIQGRPFGLPQLLDPSDELSEVYARIVERQMIRRGYEIWRYNDDFRIRIAGYDQPQGAVEALAQEASEVGLASTSARRTW